MKHIKLYEELKENNIEKFFKDKIDWKLINFLKIISTEYEDIGHNIEIAVILYSKDVVKYILWEYKSIENKEYFDETYSKDALNDIKLKYLKEGLSYYIYINSLDKNLKDERIIIIENIKEKLLAKNNITIIKQYRFCLYFKILL